jgi:hypothetical protein
MVRPRAAPSGRAPLSRRDPHPAKPTPREGRRSGRPPPSSFMTTLTAPTLTPFRGIGRGGSRRIRRRRRARRRRWIPTPPRDACICYLSGVAEPRTFTCPSSPAGAKVQPRPSRGLEGQPLSGWGCALPPSRRQTEAEWPPSWRARNAQPPSRARSLHPPRRACRAAQRRNHGCAPRCKFSTSDLFIVDLPTCFVY